MGPEQIMLLLVKFTKCSYVHDKQFLIYEGLNAIYILSCLKKCSSKEKKSKENNTKVNSAQ